MLSFARTARCDGHRVTEGGREKRLLRGVVRSLEMKVQIPCAQAILN